MFHFLWSEHDFDSIVDTTFPSLFFFFDCRRYTITIKYKYIFKVCGIKALTYQNWKKKFYLYRIISIYNHEFIKSWHNLSIIAWLHMRFIFPNKQGVPSLYHIWKTTFFLSCLIVPVNHYLSRYHRSQQFQLEVPSSLQPGQQRLMMVHLQAVHWNKNSLWIVIVTTSVIYF